MTLLQLENVQLHYPVTSGILLRQTGAVHAVDGVSLTLAPGETLGVVGESGCGKSSLTRAILRLHPIQSGRILFENQDLALLNAKDFRKIRKEIQVIFQDPAESLNPRHTVGQTIEEPFIIHKIGTSAERKKEVKELLKRVGLHENAADRYPHEFSGGQRQRIGIARAIALKPKILLCDEPVSALDVSVRAQILNLLMKLQDELGLSYLFISHDLSVVKHVSTRVAVMYLGKIVEIAPATELYANPKHPYTRALISAIPQPDPRNRNSAQKLEGEIPSPIHPPSGCRFHTRCPIAQSICKTQEPAPITTGNHTVCCHFAPNQSTTG